MGTAGEHFSNSTDQPRAQGDYNLLRMAYDRHGYKPEALRSLVLDFVDTHLNGTKAQKDIREVEEFFNARDKAVAIERPSPLSSIIGKFDAESRFSSKFERGGDPDLAKILARLDDSVLDGVPMGPPQPEPEVKRADENAARIIQEKNKAFDGAINLFTQETTRALLSDRDTGRSPGADAGYRWISDNIVGGKDICEKASRVIDTIKLIGHYGAENAQDAIRILKDREAYESDRAAKHAAKPSAPAAS